jgi:hypothetical protein
LDRGNMHQLVAEFRGGRRPRDGNPGARLYYQDNKYEATSCNRRCFSVLHILDNADHGYSYLLLYILKLLRYLVRRLVWYYTFFGDCCYGQQSWVFLLSHNKAEQCQPCQQPGAKDAGPICLCNTSTISRQNTAVYPGSLRRQTAIDRSFPQWSEKTHQLGSLTTDVQRSHADGGSLLYGGWSAYGGKLANGVEGAYGVEARLIDSVKVK